MFSFNASQSKSRRFAARAALAGLLCLASAFLFLACPMSAGNGSGGGVSLTLNGVWKSTYNDGYTITNSKFSGASLTGGTIVYDDGFGGSYGGDIAEIVKFSGTAGVIIFKYTTAPADWQGDAAKTAAIAAHVMNKYIAVYYQNLTVNSAQMGTASQWDANDQDNLAKTYPVADSLTAAKSQFTAAKTGDYISQWGDYAK